MGLSPLLKPPRALQEREGGCWGQGSNGVVGFPETAIFSSNYNLYQMPVGLQQVWIDFEDWNIQETWPFHPRFYWRCGRSARYPVLLKAHQITKGPEHPAKRFRPDSIGAESHWRSRSQGANCPWFCMSFGVSATSRLCKIAPENCKQLPHTHRDHLMEALVWKPEILFFIVIKKNHTQP